VINILLGWAVVGGLTLLSPSAQVANKAIGFGPQSAPCSGGGHRRLRLRGCGGINEANGGNSQEVVTFFEATGAIHPSGARRFPKGVLLVGPPGTAKNALLARAIAGEGGCPFLDGGFRSSSRCSWVWAPAACANLFKRAKKKAPCDHFH